MNWISQSELARRANVSREAIRKAIKSGRIKTWRKLGKDVQCDAVKALAEFRGEIQQAQAPAAPPEPPAPAPAPRVEPPPPAAPPLASAIDGMLCWGNTPMAPAGGEPGPVEAAAPPEAAILFGTLPDYTVSKARTEFERANLLELDRKTKEGLLLPREQVERVWANAITIARTKLLGVPTRVRQRVPHLTLEEVATMEELIREALEELADGGGTDGD